MRSSNYSALAAFLLFVLTGCGGGGGDGGSPNPPPPPAAPVVSFAPSAFELTTEVAITPITPTVTGGTATEWLIAPALPAGLTLNAATGQITGTPTQGAAAATFAVTGRNAGGTSTASLTLTINSGTLLELGHANSLIALRSDGTRMLSRDSRGTWALWNSATGERLARGAATCPTDCAGSIALAGTTAVIASASNLQIISASDGSSLWDTVLEPGTWWALAADGSYVALGDTSALTVRSRAGAQHLQISGGFAAARPFFAAGELRLANGPSGNSVIQKIAVPAGSATTSAGFQGSFSAWFGDGDRFLTVLPNTTSVWVYGSDGTQLGAGTLPSTVALGGRGDRIWIRVPSGNPNDLTSTLAIYSFGPGFTPVAQFPLAALANDIVPSGGTLGILTAGAMNFGLVDLSAATPTLSSISTSISHLTAYAAASATDRAFGNQDGVLMRDVAGATPPQLYSRGRVRSLAGSTTRFVVAFSSGDIEYYGAANHALQGIIETTPPRGPGFFRSTNARVQLSRDGNTLAVGSVSDDGTETAVSVYSLPSETPLNDFNFGATEELGDFSLSGSGNVLGFLFKTAGAGGLNTIQLVQIDGTILYSEPAHAGGAAVLADTGSRGAFSLLPLAENSGSRIVENGALAGTLTGAVVDWLDEQRLVVNRFRTDAFGFLVFDGVQVVGLSGQVLASPPLPRLGRNFEVVATDRIYAPELNVILDATNGDTAWSSVSTDPSPSERLGAIAGGNIVFTSFTRVRLEPYQ